MEFLTYEEVDKEVMRLCNDSCFEEAIDILKTQIEKFPEDLYTITWDMAVIYSLMTPKQIEKSMEILEYGYQKGLWYSLDPENRLWESCKNSDRFQKLVTMNKERKELAQEKSESKYEIYLPKDYTKERSYPLHIAIHGWGEDVTFFKKFWTSDVLDKDYIILFIQSSRVVSPIGYCWDDIDLARNEIINAYEKVLGQYSIDMYNITIGGFSQGGTIALDFALNGMIPIKGFIALCPDQPEGFSNGGVERMVEKHIKGIILTGEKDNALPQQEKMVEIFEEVGFSYQFIINKGLGHWFPEDLSEQLNEALGYIHSA